ncbi:MAG: hypothetical protein JST86_13435 [Bacteroidetes bacterium]|nr:hypothetical protein [Bacteroidota bacterium]
MKQPLTYCPSFIDLLAVQEIKDARQLYGNFSLLLLVREHTEIKIRRRTDKDLVYNLYAPYFIRFR